MKYLTSMWSLLFIFGVVTGFSNLTPKTISILLNHRKKGNRMSLSRSNKATFQHKVVNVDTVSSEMSVGVGGRRQHVKKVFQKLRSAILGVFLIVRVFGSGGMRSVSVPSSPTSRTSFGEATSQNLAHASRSAIHITRPGSQTRTMRTAMPKQGALAYLPDHNPKIQPVFSVQNYANRLERVKHQLKEVFREFVKGIDLSSEQRDTVLLLFSTAMITPLCKRIGLSPILGFLAIGILLGPNLLHVVRNVKTTENLAELGVVFFLFEMGLELSVERLRQMSRDVFGLGLSQFVITTLAIITVLKSVTKLSAPALITIGGGLALSSSAFVLQLLKDREDMGTRYGKASFGVLLFQDLAVVPMLVALPLLAGTGGGVMLAIEVALAKAAICFGTIAFLGKYVVGPTFFLVAKSGSQEALVSIVLTTALGMSALSEGLGLSDTLGAFLAGILLGETKYRYQVEAEVAPFRGVLLGLFFITVGFTIDLTLIAQNLPLVISSVGGILILKSTVLTLVCLKSGLSLANAQQVGLVLSQGGEFAFVTFGLAKRLGILTSFETKVLMTSVALTMAATPALSQLSAKVADMIETRKGFTFYIGQDKESQQLKEEASDLVIVCGYGRIGKMVCELLDKKFIKYVCFDIDSKKAVDARNKGLPVFFGDVSRPSVLEAFNVGKAKAVIITCGGVKTTNQISVNLRNEFPNLKIFARARNQQHVNKLKSFLNIEAMVPTATEHSLLVSLPFGGAVLENLGVSGDEVKSLLRTLRVDLIQKKGFDGLQQSSLIEALEVSRGITAQDSVVISLPSGDDELEFDNETLLEALEGKTEAALSPEDPSTF